MVSCLIFECLIHFENFCAWCKIGAYFTFLHVVVQFSQQDFYLLIPGDFWCVLHFFDRMHRNWVNVHYDLRFTDHRAGVEAWSLFYSVCPSTNGLASLSTDISL